jgi:hypothetical protein
MEDKSKEAGAASEDDEGGQKGRSKSEEGGC